MEILSIILEKGLLAVVLVLVGSFFARKLETYKSGNAYLQALSAQRLKAYEEVAELIGKHVAIVQSYWSALKAHHKNEGEVSAKLKEEGEQFQLTYEASASRLNTCALYFSKDLEVLVANHLLKYSLAMHSFKSESTEDIEGKLKELSDSANQIFLRIRSEMHQNPFQ